MAITFTTTNMRFKYEDSSGAVKYYTPMDLLVSDSYQNYKNLVDSYTNNEASSMAFGDSVFAQIFASGYSNVTSYQAGDYALDVTTSNGTNSYQLYRCLQNCTGKAVTNTTYFKPILIGQEIKDLIMVGDTEPTGTNNRIWADTSTKQEHILADYADLNTIIAAEYNNSTSYQVGDFVLYQGILYKCTAAGSGHQPTSGSQYWNTALVSTYIKRKLVPIGTSTEDYSLILG